MFRNKFLNKAVWSFFIACFLTTGIDQVRNRIGNRTCQRLGISIEKNCKIAFNNENEKIFLPTFISQFILALIFVELVHSRQKKD